MAPPAPDTDQRAYAGPRPQAASLPLASKVVPAWALLPLRLFLGLTFIDAGLGKLLSPAYFGAGPRGFATLAESFAKGSPLAGPVRAVVLAHPFLFALLLAVLELVAGICTVIGLASRLAAGIGLGPSLASFHRGLAGPAVLLRRRPAVCRRLANAAAGRPRRPAQRGRHAAATLPLRARAGRRRQGSRHGARHARGRRCGTVGRRA